MKLKQPKYKRVAEGESHWKYIFLSMAALVYAIYGFKTYNNFSQVFIFGIVVGILISITLFAWYCKEPRTYYWVKVNE